MARTKGLPAGFRRKKDKDGNETGRLEYRFTIGRDRYSVTGSTVGECRRLEQEKRDYIAEHSYIRNDRITVAQYFEEWMRSREGSVKEATLYYERLHLAPVLDRIGTERVQDIERRQVIALQSELAKSYTTQGVNHRIMLLKALLKAAVIDAVIDRNPCDGIKPLKRVEPHARDTIHRALTLEEQKAFFDAARDEWYYELYLFLIQTGCRIGEAGALKWSDIDYKHSVIHIRRTITATAKGLVIGKDTKSRASMRDIPMTAEIRETLRQQREKVHDVFGIRSVGLDSTVFVTLRGKRVQGVNINTFVGRICDREGLERFTVHAFRDTFATRCIEQGMNPQTLKTILGHSSLSMTMDLYAHVLPNTKAEEMEKIRIIV